MMFEWTHNQAIMRKCKQNNVKDSCQLPSLVLVVALTFALALAITLALVLAVILVIIISLIVFALAASFPILNCCKFTSTPLLQ